MLRLKNHGCKQLLPYFFSMWSIMIKGIPLCHLYFSSLSRLEQPIRYVVSDSSNTNANFLQFTSQN